MADAFKDSFKQFAGKKQEILSRLADTHEERIINTLKNLEDEIISDLTSLTDGGVKLNTQLAIKLRPNLKTLIEKNFLKEADSIVSEYDEIVKEYQRFIKPLPIPDRFKTLTKPDLKVINDLKFLSFSGFEDMGNRFLDTIANEVYQSSVTGRPFNEMVKNIRGQINGVYQRSNETAINRLTDYIDKNRYSENAQIIQRVKNAREILHTKYASDILGNNMRRYASQIAQDSLMQFDGQFTLYKGKEAGITKYQYVGTNITTTRSFCRTYLNRVFTEEEAREIWQTTWRGKSGTDPFINRGGYRCRHSFILYDDDWFTEETDDNIKEQTKTNDKQRQKKLNIVNKNNVYQDNSSVNAIALNQVYRNFKGSEKSIDKVDEFLKEKNTSIFYVSKSIRIEKIRQREYPKVNKIYTNTHGKEMEAYTFRAKKKSNGNTNWRNESVNIFVEPSNKVNFNFANAKIIQEGVEELLERRKKGQGNYRLKRGNETTDLDWSVSASAKGSTKEIIEANKKTLTTLHEIGHQVHYWATDVNGNIARSLKKYITYYGASSDGEFHAELFTLWASNRKALEKFDIDLVNYMDNLVETAIKSKNKGSPVF